MSDNEVTVLDLLKIKLAEDEFITAKIEDPKSFDEEFLRKNSSQLFESLSKARAHEIEAQKLEPLETPTNDAGPSNQRLGRRRKNLKKQQELMKGESQIKQEDQRSVEELLEFINANDGDTKIEKPSQQKKKKKRRKNQVKGSSQRKNSETDSKVAAQCDDILSHDAVRTSQDGSDQFLTDVEKEEDELVDQEKMEENDRIVEEFAKKLSVWGPLYGENIQ